MYTNTVPPEFRSRMNVPFTVRQKQNEGLILERLENQGFCGLKGHKTIGGFRASIYNSVEEESVDALIKVLSEFV